MRRLNLVVSCSNRKTATAIPSLQLRQVLALSVEKRLSEWCRRLTDNPGERRVAREMYAGDHWATAASIPSELRATGMTVDLWVCSAGYGLIHESALIRSYSATFSPGQMDSVSSCAMSSPAFASELAAWWSGLTQFPLSPSAPRTLCDIVSSDPTVPLLVVASEAYLHAMREDLEAVVSILGAANLLSILSVGAKVGRLESLKPFLLSADARYVHCVGGALGALNARLARELLRRVRGSEVSNSRLAELLGTMALDLPPRQKFERVRLPDHAVLAFIKEEQCKEPLSTTSKLLRRFRDAGYACEQSRFAGLFARAQENF